MIMIHYFFSAKSHLEHFIFRKMFWGLRLLAHPRGCAPRAILQLAQFTRCTFQTFKEICQQAKRAGCKVRDFLPEQRRDFTFF